MIAVSEQSGSSVSLPTDRQRFDSVNPATGEPIASFEVHTAEDVAAAVERARQAAAWWAQLGAAGRRARLDAWRVQLVRRTDELAGLIARENGKPVDDAAVEVTIAIAHLAWAARNAAKVLRRRRVNPGLLAVNHSAFVEYLPYGVVGVIGPWNYPVHTPMGSISYALAAGNAVVFKPSEYTPAVGRWLVDTFAEAVPEQPVFQLVTGFGETGAALYQAGVDKLAFTGSAATGRKVMAGCAATLTPCVIECGGKDALIVAADADLPRAAEQAVWGSMYNAGQTCAGVERVYVEAPVYQEFLDRVSAAAAGLRTGPEHGAAAHYGAITMPGQLEVISSHVRQALEHGGRALVGGPDSVRAPWVEPVVLVDVPPDEPAVTEETFGPVVVISKVADLDEAVEAANSGGYGLGASVFSRRHGRQLASRLTAGMVSINSVLTYASVPGLPWGGSGESGFGRIHGPDGLREFARSRAVTAQLFDIPLRIATFARPDRSVRQLRGLARLRWGRR
ncbi:aldehyde dehydrogenase family protein [Jatrophihabitans sp.]|uniref:aldehyde dehydrogenase family protein n=1 Tax=Jatrophihabitans sp. TaxID=1932789 RepID=UPI002C799BCB|nr:aldehyde dehydrogenase family protein [Jatrophihabitans sp.]